jgi:hypothetical protein
MMLVEIFPLKRAAGTASWKRGNDTGLLTSAEK